MKTIFEETVDPFHVHAIPDCEIAEQNVALAQETPLSAEVSVEVVNKLSAHSVPL